MFQCHDRVLYGGQQARALRCVRWYGEARKVDVCFSGAGDGGVRKDKVKKSQHPRRRG